MPQLPHLTGEEAELGGHPRQTRDSSAEAS